MSDLLGRRDDARRNRLNVLINEQDAAAQDAASVPPLSRLAGVAVSSAGGMAVFADDADGKTVALQEQDTLGDQVVASIRPGLVVLVGADGTETACRVGDACPGHPAAQGVAGTAARQGAPMPAPSVNAPGATRYVGRRMLVAPLGTQGVSQ